MKVFFAVILLLASTFFKGIAQSISISPDGSPPDSSAILDIQSTTKGLLIPRMTEEQRDSILLPALGLTIFQTDGIPGMYYYDGTEWTPVGTSTPVGEWLQNGDDIYNGNPGNIGIGTTAPEGKVHIKGDVDASELIIEASEVQSNANPLIRLRKSDGTELMWIHSDNLYNSFLGFEAGKVNNAGNGAVLNTFIGSRSGYFNTSGHENTSVGTESLRSNTLGNYNTANGCYALLNNISGSNNTACGYQTLLLNMSGSYNTAIGNTALLWNLNGQFNTAVGSESLNFNTEGICNTGIGFRALQHNITANYNTGIGSFALASNTTSSQNTAIGYGALYIQAYAGNGFPWEGNNTAVGYYALNNNQPTSIDNGIGNTAVGSYAMDYNTIGKDNTAIGNNAMKANTTGFDNTALGAGALYTNSIGSSNTALGRQALFYNDTGSGNTAMGYKALRNNNFGAYNAAFGTETLANNVAGSDVSAFGNSALKNLIGGLFNAAFGSSSLINLVNGDHNIALGAKSGTAIQTPNLNNTINIGNHGYLNAFSNQDFIGNLSTVWIGGQTTWFTYASDARVKNNVQDNVKGLDFISRLKPVTYNLDITAMRDITGNKDTEDYPEKYDIEKITQSGFLAQEVEQAAHDSGYNFNGYTTPKKNTELYTMSYSLFVVPLVKAVQELSAENTQLKAALQKVSAENETLSQRMDKIESIITHKGD